MWTRRKWARMANFYVLPPNTSTVRADAMATLRPDKQKFGILRGTWVKGKIERTTTNAESGALEIVLTESLDGKYQTLPVGTLLFASKSFNVSNRRLEAITTSAITLDGDEFTGINAYIYSLNKTAGLEGSIQRNVDGELASAGANAAIDVAKALLPNGGRVALDAATDISAEMLENQRKAGPVKPQAVIRVSPQEVYLKIAKSF